MTFDKVSEIRFFGVEDGSFKAFERKKPSYTFLCGVQTEQDKIELVRLVKIKVDGFDATEKLLSILNGIKVKAILLGGITFAGFNVIDPFEINQETGTPIIVCSGVEPENKKMLFALKKHFEDWERRWNIINKLGKIYSTIPFSSEPPIFYEVVGCSHEWAENVLHRAVAVSRMPEPIRIAGIIARGVSQIC